MNTILSPFPAYFLRPHGLAVLSGKHAASGQLLKICARLSLNESVYLFDCGNRSNMYFVAQELRSLTSDPVAALHRIVLARAFTCYQSEALLAGNRHLRDTSILIFDLMSSFFDEAVPRREAERLFDDVLDHLLKLSQNNSVLIGIPLSSRIYGERNKLIDRLRDTADVFHQIVDTPAPVFAEDRQQLSLF
jgi:hypothetical protein